MPAGGLGLEGGEILLVIAQLCWSWYSIRAQQWLADRGQIALSALTSSVASVLLARGLRSSSGRPVGIDLADAARRRCSKAA